MQYIGALITLLSIIALFVGMIRPSIFKGSRSDVLKFCVIGFFGGLVVFMFFSPKRTPQQDAAYAEQKRIEKDKEIDAKNAALRNELNLAEVKKRIESDSKIEPSVNLASMAKFSAIKNGMKAADVYAIMGGEGEVISESEVANIRTSMHVWQEDSGFGNMNVMFQRGVVIAKAQFGLK